LAHALGEASSTLLSPANPLCVDESLYEFEGKCPVKRYIPRKPHPNGLLVYGIASYIYAGVDAIPFVLDFEPYTVNNQVTAQDAMIRLLERLRQRRPDVAPSLVADSAFGSFEKLGMISAAGGSATMSMSPTVTPWLWELLNWDCGIEEGRAAFIPDENIVVSSFQVLTERREAHQIKIISSACEIERPEANESVVGRISDSRRRGDQLEYLTHFTDGTDKWLSSDQFIDDDGTANSTWLDFASQADLEAAFSAYTQKQLQVRYFHFFSYTLVFTIFANTLLFQAMCAAQGWKSTGDKGTLARRIAGQQKALTSGKEGTISLLESRIGPKLGSDGPAGQLRDFYRANFQALDRFDRVWYEIRFHHAPRDWESHFSWSLVHAAVINARAAWCAITGERVGGLEFLCRLAACYRESLLP